MLIERPLLIPAALIGLAGLTAAQTTLSGNIYDGNGGPLTAGTVYLANTNLTVPAGETLTVAPDVVVKFKTGLDWRLSVDGTMIVNGTAAQPTVFTSILDDSIGGDTGADGPTVGAPGSWAGIRVNASGSLVATEMEIRYGGRSSLESLYVSGGSVDLVDSRIQDGGNSGIGFAQIDTTFTRIEGCSITGCEDWAMDDVPIDVIEGIKNNFASGNGVDAIRMPGTTGLVVDGDVTIGPENCLNGALVFQGALNQDPGTTLTFQAGAVIKMASASATRWSLDGTLRIEGTDADPVVFTSADDDDHGGDTFGDGPTSGAPGDWAGIDVNVGAVLEADHWIHRFGGKSESLTIPPVYADGGSITLRDCVLRDSLRSALDANQSTVPMVVEGCDFIDNADWPILDATFEVISGFFDNTATGNGNGDYIRMFHNVNADAEAFARNMINGALVFESQLNVGAGARLTLHEGVVLKTPNDMISVQGALDVLGTAIAPVVFTTLTDDAVGGDTNGDGPSVGTPGAWPGIRIQTDADTSTLRHAVVRFSGLSHPGIWARSPLTHLHSVRVEHGSRDGFELDAAASAINLVAWDNGLKGIHIDDGTFDLVHATAVGNGGTGIDHGAFYTGVIRNSIAWDNGGAGNYDHVSAADLVFSNGDPGLAGTDGNLDVDPLFVDAANGDLRLAPGSPCVDVADFATAFAVVTDHSQNSRILPGGLGAGAADMGAYEQARWTLTASGPGVAGELLTLGVEGETGIAYFAFGQLDAVAYFDPFGFVLAGLATLKPLPNPIAVGDQISFPVPDVPALYGTGFGMQGVGISSVTVGLIHYTNLYESRFEAPLF